MQALKERIIKEGKVLPGNIIKVDGFLNHRVDVAFMEQIADEFAKYFRPEGDHPDPDGGSQRDRPGLDLRAALWRADGLCEEGQER